MWAEERKPPQNKTANTLRLRENFFLHHVLGVLLFLLPFRSLMALHMLCRATRAISMVMVKLRLYHSLVGKKKRGKDSEGKFNKKTEKIKENVLSGGLMQSNLIQPARALSGRWCLLFSRHKGAEENGSRRRCDPPTHWQSSTVGDARLQNNSLVVIGVSYSVCIQEVFVEHSHLFAVEGPSPPWGSGGGTAQKKRSDTTSKLLKGCSKLFLTSCYPTTSTQLLSYIFYDCISWGYGCVSSPCSSRMVKPLAFNCDEIKVSFSCKKNQNKML